MDITLRGDAGMPKDLFRQYYPRLCDFAKRLLADGDEAEDIVQDAYVVFLEQRANIDNHPLAAKSFLYSSVKHACLNRLRHGKVVLSYQEKNQPEIVDDKHILQAIIHAEVIGELHRALDSLPEGCALVIRLGYLEGLKNPQIADELGISINTVKSQKQRALLLLREKLSPQAMAVLLPVLLSI